MFASELIQYGIVLRSDAFRLAGVLLAGRLSRQRLSSKGCVGAERFADVVDVEAERFVSGQNFVELKSILLSNIVCFC